MLLKKIMKDKKLPAWSQSKTSY